MTNFEFFKNKCQKTNEFGYHIYYKNSKYESCRNTLEELNNINEDSILYFEGFYQDGKVFRDIDTLSDTQPNSDLTDLNLNSTFRIFGVNVLYNLKELGVELEKVNALLKPLYIEYITEEKNLGTAYLSRFIKLWEDKFLPGWLDDNAV